MRKLFEELVYLYIWLTFILTLWSDDGTDGFVCAYKYISYLQNVIALKDICELIILHIFIVYHYQLFIFNAILVFFLL